MANPFTAEAPIVAIAGAEAFIPPEANLSVNSLTRANNRKPIILANKKIKKPTLNTLTICFRRSVLVVSNASTNSASELVSESLPRVWVLMSTAILTSSMLTLTTTPIKINVKMLFSNILKPVEVYFDVILNGQLAIKNGSKAPTNPN